MYLFAKAKYGDYLLQMLQIILILKITFNLLHERHIYVLKSGFSK